MKQITIFHQGKEIAKCHIEDENTKSFTHLLNFLCRAAMSQAYNLQYEIKENQERVWRVTCKERKATHPIISNYSGKLDKSGIINFFGLHHSDVEWYRIEEIILIEEQDNIKA